MRTINSGMRKKLSHIESNDVAGDSFERMDIMMQTSESMKKKVKNKHGFTLAETLLAVLILMLVSTIVATGIPAAKNAYEKVVLASNAEALFSTAITSLRNELGTARNIEIDGTTITYYNETRGTFSKIYLNTTNPNTIMFQRSVSDGDMGKGSDPVWLVSKTASTGNLYVTYESITPLTDGIITIKKLSVNRESGGSLTEPRNLSIRVISG